MSDAGARYPRGGPARPGRDWSGGTQRCNCLLCGDGFLGVPEKKRVTRCRVCHNRLRRDAYASKGGVYTSRKRGRTEGAKWSNYRASAKRRGLSFSLPRDEFAAMLARPCHWCGRRRSNGVDRLDSGAGYESGNVVPCCGVCNTMKMTANGDDFIAQCRRIAARHP